MRTVILVCNSRFMCTANRNAGKQRVCIAKNYLFFFFLFRYAPTRHYKYQSLYYYYFNRKTKKRKTKILQINLVPGSFTYKLIESAAPKTAQVIEY